VIAALKVVMQNDGDFVDVIQLYLISTVKFKYLVLPFTPLYSPRRLAA
jgi:hypothetical protein